MEDRRNGTDRAMERTVERNGMDRFIITPFLGKRCRCATQTERTVFGTFLDTYHYIQHQLNRIHSLRKQYKRNPFSHNSHHLSLAEHQLQCDILDARANYEGRLVTEFSFSNDSRVYHYIKSLSGQNKLLDVMYWGSDSASTAAGKANLFNEFFHSVFNGNTET